MFKVLTYIFYPSRFVQDMRAFRVTEFSVFLLFLIGLLLGIYLGWGAAEVTFAEVGGVVLFCVLSYALYVWYKVSWMPWLTLYFSIGTIATVWSWIMESLLLALANYFVWEISYDALLALSFLVWGLIYVVLFHAICRDMESRRNDGMVVVRKG